MGRLVEGVEGYSAAGGVGGFRKPPASGEGEAKSTENLTQDPLMVFFFASLPVLEVGAVPKIETGHERPAEQSRGRRQPWRTLGAEPVGPVRMIDSHELADLVNITAPVVAVQPDTGSVAVEPPPRKTGPQRRQGPSQGRPGPIGIQVGPQEVGELLSGRLFSGDRQVGE